MYSIAWYLGIRTHRGKGLAAFLKAIGYLIPLMDAEYASYYTKEVMLILIREFVSPDEEMKKIVLKASLKMASYTYCHWYCQLFNQTILRHYMIYELGSAHNEFGIVVL